MKMLQIKPQDLQAVARLNDIMQQAGQAAKAEAITPQESILIGSVQGYASKEARHIDDKRRADGMQTRKGAKKAEAVSIPEDIAQALKAQPGTTGQGRPRRVDYVPATGPRFTR